MPLKILCLLMVVYLAGCAYDGHGRYAGGHNVGHVSHLNKYDDRRYYPQRVYRHDTRYENHHSYRKDARREAYREHHGRHPAKEAYRARRTSYKEPGHRQSRHHDRGASHHGRGHDRNHRDPRSDRSTRRR